MDDPNLRGLMVDDLITGRRPLLLEDLNRASRLITRRVALGWVGQSNERGQGRYWNSMLGSAADPAAYQTCWNQSATNGQRDPIAPSLTGGASWWPPLADLARARGTAITLVNGAIGGISFMKHVCGQMKSWAANTAFFQSRTASLAGDGGYKGDLILVGTQMWRCTTGNGLYVSLDDPAGLTLYQVGSDLGNTIKRLDYILYDRSNSTLLKSGGTQPNFASITTPGSTISDGGLVWTLVSNSAASPYNGFVPFPRTATEFDPLGILSRVKTSLDAVGNVDQRWFAFSNGQSDVQGSVGVQSTIQTWYANALQNISDWGVNAGYKVLIGFTCRNVTDELAGLDYRWQTLDAAWEQAIAARVDNVNVFAGANLYRSLRPDAGVYPEVGYTGGLHLSDAGLRSAAKAWDAALAAAGL